MSFFENTRKPIGVGGKLMVDAMNFGHRALAEWGMDFLDASGAGEILDCGCGGGANLRKLLDSYPQAAVTGIDYSPVSVEKSGKVNAAAVREGRCRVLEGSVAELPLAEAQFDAVTAFETVYFWPNLLHCFREVYRVLKPGGTFLICNEVSDESSDGSKWTEIIEGMTVYTAEQLIDYLKQAGFCEIERHSNKKGWLCVTGQKQEE